MFFNGRRYMGSRRKHRGRYEVNWAIKSKWEGRSQISSKGPAKQGLGKKPQSSSRAERPKGRWAVPIPEVGYVSSQHYPHPQGGLMASESGIATKYLVHACYIGGDVWSFTLESKIAFLQIMGNAGQ